MSKRTGHKIKDYDATNDVVVCVCDFIGTADEFHAHRSGNNKHSLGTLNFLKDIPKARYNYPTQGSLIGTGKRYGK